MLKSIAFIDSYSDLSGGAPKSMLALAQLLKGRNIDVCVVTAVEGALVETCSNHGLRNEVLNTPKILLVPRSKQKKTFFWFFNFLYFLFVSWIKSYKKIINNSSVVYCVNDIRCFLFYLPFLIVNRKKVVWYIRIKDRVKIITCLAGIVSSRIILVSESCRDVFTPFEKKRFDKKISVVHTGFKVGSVVEPDFRKNEEEAVVVSLGVLSERKNVELLLKSIPNLTVKSPIRFLIVGEEKKSEDFYKKYLESLVAQKQLADIVKLVGHRDDIDYIYSQADILSLTSKAEGLPRVAIEALSYGCFVCSTPVDGIDEIVTSSELGIVSKNYEVESYTNALDETLRRLSEIKRSTELRRSYVKVKFSEESFANNFLSAIGMKK